MKVIICGYKGKMGSLVYKRLKNDRKFEIIDLVEKDTKPLEDIIKHHQVDVVIDFTNANTCLKHANLCLLHNVHFLSGTTGIAINDLKYLDKCSKSKGLSFIISPNFSLGINAIIKVLPLFSSYFDDIFIEEQHHISKIDTPSGTALEIKKYLKKDVKIKSIRNESNEMYHKIVFKHKNEELMLMHKTSSRKAYIDGIVYCLNKMGTFKGLKRTIQF